MSGTNQSTDKTKNSNNKNTKNGKSSEEEKDDDKEGEETQQKKTKSYNPLQPYLEERKRKQIEKERILLLREERMLEDLERYLMEIEEKRSWAVLRLNALNYQRIVKREQLAKVERKLYEKEQKEKEENMKEDGLFYSQGSVESYKRWQQSPAQHIDFEGHHGAVVSCKLSSSLQYVLSCSEDYTMKIWSMMTGECLKTFTGHTRVVNDADFHPTFKMYDFSKISIVSCSGDCTLKLWNSSHTTAVSTMYGHSQAVYRCCFAPDGNSILSCSEDKTVRSWSYPEGYNLFVYRAHTSAVVSISYSGSGKYFVSGSDYGERKILLWDAKLPHFHDPLKFPHVIYWSSEGLITKILIRKGLPKTSFWIAQSQLGLLTNDNDLDIWSGELSDDEPEVSEDERNSDNEDDDDDEEEKKNKKKRKDQSDFPDDVKQFKGVILQITSISQSGEKLVASEYNPGGQLIISVKNTERLVQEAFISATIKETRVDTFSANAGTKIGDFSLDAAIPWLPTVINLDDRGRPVQKREPSKALAPSKDQHSLIYRKPLSSMTAQDFVNNSISLKTDISTRTTSEDVSVFDVVWNCPGPDLGAIVIIVNFCFVDSKEWHQLRYSLRESPVRYVQGSGGVATNDNLAGTEHFSFDQIERHRLFWSFIRDKEWKSAAAFIDKKAIAFVFDEAMTKRFRIVNALADIFDPATWAVLYTPFIFKPGVTKSMLICDTNFLEEDDDEEEEELPPPVARVDNADDENPENPQQEEVLSQKGDEEPNTIHSVGSKNSENPSSYQKITSVEDIPPAVTTDIDLIPKLRPTTRDLQLPKLIFLLALNDKTLSKELHGKIHHLATRIIHLENASMDIALEIGCSYLHPLFISFLEEYFNPTFLLNFPWKNQLKYKDIFQFSNSSSHSYDQALIELSKHQQQKLQKFLSSKRKKFLSDGDIGGEEGSRLPGKKDDNDNNSNNQVNLNSLIKSGKFGPEIEEFSMPLPPNFPIRAGLSKHALYEGRTVYEEILKRMATESLPKTLEEVYVPTYQERFHSWYERMMQVEERKYREKLQSILQGISKLQLFQEKSYFARRRASYLYLPGLNSHYPNPNYPVPAVIPREVDFSTTKNNYKRMFYDLRSDGKEALKSVIVPPVGRKPSPSLMIEIQNAFFQKRFHAAMINNYSSFGNNNKIEYKTDVLDNLVSGISFNTTETKKSFGCFPFFRRNSIAKVNPPPLPTVPPALSLIGPQPSTISLIGGTSSADLLSAPSDANLINTMNLSPVNPNTTNLKNNGKKSGKKKKSSKKRPQREYILKNAPEGVYLGRRSFYPVLPGLEYFLDTELAFSSLVSKEAKTLEKDNPQSEEQGTMVKVTDSSVVKEETKFPGLISRFLVNGFELAHHGSVNDVSFSPSENRIATAGGDHLIKVWDPRDGTYVYRLAGHSGAVLSVQYTSTEQFLVSAGSDSQILIWSLLTKSVQRALRGHIDLVHRISISPDCSILVSAANDGLLKSWCTTPRHPDPPKPPKVLTVTDTTALISWVAPPCFNCDVTAFHYQYRVGYKGEWVPPENGQSLAPHLRNRVIEGLIPATHYQFRLRAENRMGKGDWSQPTPLIRTNFGLPETIQKPIVCQTTTNSMIIGWFTANPTTFGSASRFFEIQSCGDGKTFENSFHMKITLEEGMELGKKILFYFDKMRQRYYQTKDALIKSHGFLLLNRQSNEEKKEFPISLELSIDLILSILEKTENDETMIFVGANYAPLHPGYQYIFRVKGLNVAGEGEWSEPTLTINAQATIPDPPSQPRLVNATLRALTFQWDPPHEEGGSAITGYRVYLKNNDKTIELPRSTVSYTWEGLFPGKAYYLRVLAKNSIGESDYSPYNDETESRTMIAPPEKPMNPLAIAATWNTITYEISLPYHNGATITKMEIEKRLIKPFHIGEWENYENIMSNKLNAVLYQSENKFYYHLESLQHFSKNITTINRLAKDEFELIEYIDLQKQQAELEGKIVELELLRTKSSINLLSQNAKGNKINQAIESLLQQQKPFGSKIQFVVNNLAPDMMYEIRAAFWNSAGRGEFSHPSHRAKTTKAALPEICEAPHILTYGMNYVVLELYIPEEGGSPVRHFTVECMDLDTNATMSYTVLRNEYDIQHRQQKQQKKKEKATEKETVAEVKNNQEYDEDDKLSYQVDGLKLGGSYVFRCRAESEVGTGPYSIWSAEANLLSEETDLSSANNNNTAGTTNRTQNKKK